MKKDLSNSNDFEEENLFKPRRVKEREEKERLRKEKEKKELEEIIKEYGSYENYAKKHGILIAKTVQREFIEVVPLSPPSGLIFYLDFTYKNK